MGGAQNVYGGKKRNAHNTLVERFCLPSWKKSKEVGCETVK
jgi:hypothetical protein